MKAFMILFGSLFCLGTLLPAQDVAEDATEEVTEQVETVSIPDMVKEAKYVTKVKPKKKAYVYYFLRSHSRCGFCRKIVPQMNELYKEMKNKGAEVIMLNGDPDTEKAAAWAKEMDITIPMVTPESCGPIAAVVPGGGSGGSPNVTAVMADGTRLDGVSGASKCPELVGSWKDMVKEAKKAEAEKKAEAKKAKKAKAKKKKKKSVKDDSDEL
ncbi:MAG: redoxin domain-containing protein [Akkermansia sp.]|nr:redoxin domain-containing protein [Akkermansia sp.]